MACLFLTLLAARAVCRTLSFLVSPAAIRRLQAVTTAHGKPTAILEQHDIEITDDRSFSIDFIVSLLCGVQNGGRVNGIPRPRLSRQMKWSDGIAEMPGQATIRLVASFGVGKKSKNITASSHPPPSPLLDLNLDLLCGWEGSSRNAMWRVRHILGFSETTIRFPRNTITRKNDPEVFGESTVFDVDGALSGDEVT
ncbi:hypothetical protein B0H12DRAFT_1216400 [Mycena haematopus]|nr:hypothetical protein B0H12DRAFT_1216400 [Mycena haematopus]